MDKWDGQAFIDKMELDKKASVIVAMTAGKQDHQLIDRLLPAILLDKMADLVSAKLIFMRLSIIKYKRT